MSLKTLIDGLYSQVYLVLIATVFLLVIFGVVQTFLRTRSWVPTLGALLIGAVALWGVNSIEGLGRAVDRTVGEADGNGGGLGDLEGLDGLDGDDDEDDGNR